MAMRCKACHHKESAHQYTLTGFRVITCGPCEEAGLRCRFTNMVTTSADAYRGAD